MYYASLRKYTTILLFVILAILLIAYGYYQSKSFLSGPQLSINTPIDGETFAAPLILIEGIAKNISKITLNDRQIFVDENGVFSEKLLLLEGYNIITLEAEDKFDRKVKKELELVLFEESSVPETEILEENNN